MIYRVFKNGVEIAKSKTIPASEIFNSYGRYQTSWKYRLPAGKDSIISPKTQSRKKYGVNYSEKKI